MKHNLPLGVGFALGGTFFYSAQATVVKLHLAALPISMVLFIQCLVGLICFLPILFSKGYVSAKNIITTQNFLAHLLRTILSLGIIGFLFCSVKFIPLVNAMLLSNTTPIILPVVAYLFLSQRINNQLWLPILIGFAGVVLVLHPDGRIFHPAAFLALGAAICSSGTVLIVRKVSATDSSATIMFYFFLLATLISGVFAYPVWVSISYQLWLMLISVGVMYFISQYLITYALKFANAQLVSSLLYMNIVYSALFTMIIWHALPSPLTLAGVLLTVAGGILCIRVEQQQHKNAGVIFEKVGYAAE